MLSMQWSTAPEKYFLRNRAGIDFRNVKSLSRLLLPNDSYR